MKHESIYETIHKMRYKILKCIDVEISFVCFDYEKETRSLHELNISDTIHTVNDEKTYNYDEFEWNDPKQYELLYEFDSIEEFKEKYPEELV